MKKNLLFSLFILLTLFSYSQSNLDSLWGVWNDETAPDSSRAIAMHKFCWNGYLFSQPDSAFYYAQLLYEFSNSKGLKKEMATALGIQGISFYVRSDYPQALDYYQRCLNIYEDISYKEGMAKTLNNFGVIYSIQGDYAKALYYYQRSSKIKEEISDKSGMAGAMNNMGLIYMNQGDYPNALRYFRQSLKIKEEVSDQRGIAQTLNNIGLIYKKQGDDKEALECFWQSLNICEGISDKDGMAGTLSNIGLIYMNQKDYSQALEYYLQSLKINEEISNKRGMAAALNNIGIIYMNQRSYSKAMEFYEKSLQINEEISDKRGIANTYTNIGSIRNKQGNHAQAIIWCEKSLRTSKEINILDEEKNACLCLWEAYKALGNNLKALDYHERIAKIDDILQAEETTKDLKQMEFAKQMLVDSLLREEEKLRIQIAHDKLVAKKNRTRNIYIFSVLVLFIGAVALYRRIVFARRAKKAIEYEKERSEKLLLNILPGDIADELKEKGRAEARRFEKVSILFTDFMHFTEISEKLGAEELVEEINTCFEPFDAICRKYGIEKIKTIGDSYMAAGGLPAPSANSVKNTVLAGIEMTEFVIQRKQMQDSKGKLCFEMRVGIHTGSVVAGIVGVSKFQYDIWGDTVNIASRIENVGEAGRVNISHSTYELIKNDPDFKFESRGMVTVKGKGEMEMWFVERAS